MLFAGRLRFYYHANGAIKAGNLVAGTKKLNPVTMTAATKYVGDYVIVEDYDDPELNVVEIATVSATLDLMQTQAANNAELFLGEVIDNYLETLFDLGYEEF